MLSGMFSDLKAGVTCYVYGSCVRGAVTHDPPQGRAAGATAGEDRYATSGPLVALWTWCLDNANALSGCLADIGPNIFPDI